MLSRYTDRLEVRDRIILGEQLENGPVDVALYDTYGRVGLGSALRELADHDDIGAVVVFTLDLNERLIADARQAGARGFISKALPGERVADGIVAVAMGEDVVVAP